MPSFCHCSINSSRFKIFFDSRYIAGVRACCSAMSWTWMIGDWQMRPAANQFSWSATQKSGSEWVIMAWVSVMMMSSCTENDWPDLFR